MDEAGERVYTTTDPPRSCPAGHPFGPYAVIISFQHCRCNKAPGLGHTAWKCVECGRTVYAHGHTADDDSEFFY